MGFANPPDADESDPRVQRIRAFAERFLKEYPGNTRKIALWKISVERPGFVVYYVRMDVGGEGVDEEELADAARLALRAQDPELAAITGFIGEYEK